MFLRESKIIAFIALFGNVSLAYMFRGFELGHTETTTIYISGGSGYDLLANYYTYIFLALLVFIIGKFIKKGVLSQILCLSSLALTMFLYRTVYLQKSLFADSTDTFTQLMRDTIPLDWVSFSLVLVLFIIQIILVFQQFFWVSKDK